MEYLTQIVRGYKFASGTLSQVSKEGFDSLFDKDRDIDFDENYKGRFLEQLGAVIFSYCHPITSSQVALTYLLNRDVIDKKFQRRIAELEQKIEDLEKSEPMLETESGEKQLCELVKELCEVTQNHPEEFKEEIHVPYAQTIVDELADTITLSFASNLKTPTRSYGVGDEKRIDEYIVSKEIRWQGIAAFNPELHFEHFWDREHDIIFERTRPATCINYRKKDKKVRGIFVENRVPYFFHMGRLHLEFGIFKRNYFWGR